jgi:hypothetical protein
MSEVKVQTFTFVRPAPERRLKCGKLDLNDLARVKGLVHALAQSLADRIAWHRLEVHSRTYFRTPDGELPAEPGWYVIDGDRKPIYVGLAEEGLNRRLNSNDADGFAHSTRTYESRRNFIKALRTMGYIADLRVGVIREPDLLRQIGLPGPLEPRDRKNIETMLDLFRHSVV